jgi:pyruvate-ferredoxin/flavodoxin oxidoreductase
MTTKMTLDGNEAAAYIAHKTNELIAIYPITPASAMGELADAWSAQGRPNLWGSVPQVVEMQSEAGAAGVVHGALQAGVLATTFTASQGLLLMIPNMYKIAGELTPVVIHVAARTVATHALSIFCDHSDVMAVRATGFALLSAGSVQEAMDFSLLAQAATLGGRVPVVHFFDGFRTSHEIAKVDVIDDAVIAAMIQPGEIAAHRARCLSPDHPVIRGTAQNPDVFFQGREACSGYYNVFADKMQSVMNDFATHTGRQYHLFDYAGDPQAERVVVLMGSGAETVEETARAMCAQGEKVGVVKVRLYRPFAADAFISALPATTQRIAVLDRTKEPGANGEPLYKDVIEALFSAAQNHRWSGRLPLVVGGRYGLSSKEFTPGMAKAVFDALAAETVPHGFTVGIDDDVFGTSLPWDRSYRVLNGAASAEDNAHTFQAVFYGLGADGTVSANKNAIKIIGEQTPLNAQGYFVYDSKKSGAVTVSHLRFGPAPIRAPYLIDSDEADYVGCHQSVFLERYDVLEKARNGAVFVLNTNRAADTVWDSLPAALKSQLVRKNIRFYVIDAYRVAAECNMGKHINTVMQVCFFALSGVLPKDEAIAHIKQAVEKSYGKKGRHIVETNFRAIDQSLAGLQEVAIPSTMSDAETAGNNTVGEWHGDSMTPFSAMKLPADAPEFVRQVTARIVQGQGDRIPVSQLPVDGTFPVGTAKYEKRNLAQMIPVWETDLCTHCGKCAFVCPHSAIRSKAFPVEAAAHAPANFKHVQIKGKDYPEGVHISYQVAPEDCTGCTLCVDICPIRDKRQANRKALNMVPQPPLREQEKQNWDFFLQLPDLDRAECKVNTMKGAMLLEPLFEFSGACSGCGETPYIRLATQLFGDRMVVANATGCSSIYGGNLPTTPWSKNAEGRGPAWSNSLFEDNAEFGMGLRLACDKQRDYALELLNRLKPQLGDALVDALNSVALVSEAEIHEQRERVTQLQALLATIPGPEAEALLGVAEALNKRSVWIIGGDGWAYDIGFGGLDHVLASNANVNILVLDTEVYSNTGGQTSKATPLGAVAKFSAAGKRTGKKDLARMAMTYGHVYVAQVAYGAKDVHTLHTFLEAEAYEGPSLIIAYAPCIAHGVDMAHNHQQQQLAVDTGHWSLLRYDPRRAARGLNPLQLDTKAPSVPYRAFLESETRFNMLWRSHPHEAEQLLAQAQQDINARHEALQTLANDIPVATTGEEKPQ